MLSLGLVLFNWLSKGVQEAVALKYSTTDISPTLNKMTNM